MEFNPAFEKLINIKVLSVKEIIMAIFFKNLLLKRRARVAYDEYFSLIGQVPLSRTLLIKKEIIIEPYVGENKYVLCMMRLLEENLKDDLIGAYIHGSLGVGDEISYSDFDAMIIIKDKVIADIKRLLNAAEKLNSARKIMYALDPLQHHGWFLVTEHDLKNYPENYFPHELFKYAKSLFVDKGLSLELNSDQENDGFHLAFKSLCERLNKMGTKQQIPENKYEYKNFLSECMLLPAFYIQARYKKGIFKKFSFDEARKDFSQNDWKIIDAISKIRYEWNYRPADWQKRIICLNPYLSAHFAKLLAQPISKELKSKIKNYLLPEIIELSKKMNARLGPEVN